MWDKSLDLAIVIYSSFAVKRPLRCSTQRNSITFAVHNFSCCSEDIGGASPSDPIICLRWSKFSTTMSNIVTDVFGTCSRLLSSGTWLGSSSSLLFESAGWLLGANLWRSKRKAPACDTIRMFFFKAPLWSVSVWFSTYASLMTW